MHRYRRGQEAVGRPAGVSAVIVPRSNNYETCGCIPRMSVYRGSRTWPTSGRNDANDPVCKNSAFEVAHRISVSVSSLWKPIAPTTSLGRSQLRKQFCASLAQASFHTGWTHNRHRSRRVESDSFHPVRPRSTGSVAACYAVDTGTAAAGQRAHDNCR
jgi:hypothetical protein